MLVDVALLGPSALTVVRWLGQVWKCSACHAIFLLDPPAPGASGPLEHMLPFKTLSVTIFNSACCLVGPPKWGCCEVEQYYSSWDFHRGSL
mmetsp:Transcript_48517/g.96583  ORF Transcript_48517/g.96583 Transcript_48517/m.96583 type:complete len:91 (+) Transcript_48517:611-883(+)